VKNEFFPKFDDTEWFVENLWTQLRAAEKVSCIGK
jgi:hypothetical protein